MTTIEQVRRQARRWWVKAESARWLYGTLGRKNSDGTVTIASGRQNFVYVTMDSGTLTEAYNKGNGAVPLRAGLPVRVRQEAGRLIIDGENTSGLLEGDDNMPGTVYSVNDVDPDSHGNVALDTDDIDEGSTNLYYTSERARDDIGAALVAGTGITVTPNDSGDTITIASTVTAYTDEQAQDAVGTILVDSASIDFTYSDATPWITATIIDEYVADLVGTMVTGNTETGITVTYQDSDNTLDFVVDAEFISDTVGAMVTGNTETDIAVTYDDSDNTLDFVVSATLVGDRIHAATGKTTPVDADELGLADSAASFVLKKLTWANLKATIKTYYDSVATTLTNKTLDSTNIASLTGKTTPVDADSVVIVDSAASNVFKAVTGTNWKAYIKTYFDTLYGRLAAANTWTAANIFTFAGATIVERTTTGTNTLAGAQVLKTTSSNDMTDGFGTGFLFQIRDTAAVDNTVSIVGGIRDGADNSGAFIIFTYLAGVGSEQVRVTSAGLVGFGVTAPQGLMHGHDGVGGSMFVTKSAVAGTKVVIIANATGDVLSSVTCMYALANSDGTKIGSTFNCPVSGSVPVTVGGTTWTFSVAANGEFSVIRTAGTDTAIIAMQLVWR